MSAVVCAWIVPDLDNDLTKNEHQGDSTMITDCATHCLTSNAHPGAVIIQRKKGDYRSIVLQYDPESFLTETCLGRCSMSALVVQSDFVKSLHLYAVPLDMFVCSTFFSLLTTSSNYMTDSILTPSIS